MLPIKVDQWVGYSYQRQKSFIALLLWRIETDCAFKRLIICAMFYTLNAEYAEILSTLTYDHFVDFIFIAL